jgi:hypothetical protein
MNLIRPLVDAARMSGEQEPRPVGAPYPPYEAAPDY